MDRLGLTDDYLRELIAAEVSSTIQRATQELFGSIKTTMIELFDERYALVSEVVAATTTVDVVAIGAQVRGSFQCRWISDMDGCFFTCSCLEEWKVKCALNVLYLSTKYWC